MAGRIRTIKPELLSDAKTAGLSDGAFRLFVGMILLADDAGRLPADVRYLTAQVFWATPDGSTQSRTEVTDARRELARAGLVDVYTVREQEYAVIRSWSKHQRIDRPSPPKCPAPGEADGPSPQTPGPGREPSIHTPAPTAEHSTSPREDSSNARRDVVESSTSVRCGIGREGKGEDLKPQQPPSGAGVGSTSTATQTDPQPAPPPDAVREVFEHWRVTMGKDARTLLSDRRGKKVRARLREGYTVEQLKRAIDGCKASPHHRGQTNGTVYDDLELICRDPEHVDMFLGLTPKTNVLPFQPLQRSASEPSKDLSAEQRQAAARAAQDRLAALRRAKASGEGGEQ